MSVEITPVSTTVSGGWLTLTEDVPAGAFLALSGIQRQNIPGVSLFITDSVGNTYGIAWSMSVAFGLPRTWIALGLVSIPIPAGERFLLDGSFPELAYVRRISGADSWEMTLSAQQGFDVTGVPPHNAAWSLPGQAAQYERVLVGVVGFGNAAFGGSTLAGASASPVTQELFVPAAGPLADEWWSCMHFHASVNPSSAEPQAASGEFGVAQPFWAGAHLVLRPAFRGAGNRVSFARGADGRLLVADATSGTPALRRYGDGAPDNEVGVGIGISGGNSCSLQPHRDGRWSLVTVEQDIATHPDGGYRVLLHESKDQGRNWSVEELFSWEEPLTEHVGYQAALHAVHRRSGLLLLMLYSHRESQWLSCVGHRNSAGTGWSFTDPVVRVTGALPRAALLALPEGKFRFAYVTEGTPLRLVSVTLFGFGAITEEPLGAERAVQYVTVSNLTEEGGGDWSAPTTVATAAPTSSHDGITDVPTYDAVYLAQERPGRLLVAAHHTLWTLSEHTLPSASQQTYLFAGTPDPVDGGWSFAPWAPMAVTASGRDAFLRARADGGVEWNCRIATGELRACASAGPWRRTARGAGADGS